MLIDKRSDEAFYTWVITPAIVIFFHFSMFTMLQLFQINHKNSVISTTSYTTFLEERTLFEGFCSLQHGADTPWITKFTFNLSNDDNYYSENFTVFVYNSPCQTIHNDSGNVYFTLQVCLWFYKLYVFFYSWSLFHLRYLMF